MRILRKPPAPKELKCTCMECETLFAFTKEEGITDRDRDGLHVRIKCPNCKHENFVAIE